MSKLKGGSLIAFKFKTNQVVKTPFGEKGIISMLGYDDGGQTYFTKTKGGGGSWFKESELKPSK